MVRRLAVAAALGAGVAGAALLAGVGLGWWRGEGEPFRAASAFEVTASLEPRTLSFGDPLAARLHVVVDPRRVDPTSVRPVFRLAPYQIVSRRESVRRSRTAVLLQYALDLECLTPRCVPTLAQSERRLEPVEIRFRLRSGATQSKRADWPSLKIGSHLSDADRASPGERLRTDAPLPPVSYRVDPGALRAGFVSGAALFGLAAVALAWLGLRRGRSRRAEPELEPLSRALALVRASAANGAPAERRRALGRLARELRRNGRPELAAAAAGLAWSAAAPSPEAAGTFAEQVEETL